MTTTTRKPSKKNGSRKPKVTKKTKTKKTTKTKNTKKSTRPRTRRTITREVIREIPVYYTDQRVPFMPFNAMNTHAATNNLLGYMRGLLDGKNDPGIPRVNPMLIPTNTRRSERKPVFNRMQGDRALAQELLNSHYERTSRFNDTRTSVFDDIERGMGVRPQRIAL